MTNDEFPQQNAPEENPAEEAQAPEAPATTPAATDAPGYTPPVIPSAPEASDPLTPSAAPTYAPPVFPSAQTTGAPTSAEPAAPTYAAPLTPPAPAATPEAATAPAYGAAPAAPPAYGAPVATAPAYSTGVEGTPQSAKTNVCAILSLVFAFVFQIAGIVLGHVALSQIKKTGEEGRGLAIAGLIIGYVLFALSIIAVIVWVLVVAAFIASEPSGYYY
ncbi:DUF4190 domain-containing protein [Leucobacter sp. UCMA 4100]|uniref:DUF4190 domain-containing protein n=1 Tax=Leucobacter sp. UCMA 4100 TaxID=2810534 RepID=UPI0022EAE8FB|nr:DUF4190 domain-containing protein [Leucobacter sp. UCMA 4100]MDA3146182.1 DUF4190 domain-containing protein [Leucobacter sp. UCMA 4100]